MTMSIPNYDAWRLQGPPEPRIEVQWNDTEECWDAWDDRLGIDRSPIGQGPTQEKAIEALNELMEPTCD